MRDGANIRQARQIQTRDKRETIATDEDSGREESSNLVFLSVRPIQKEAFCFLSLMGHNMDRLWVVMNLAVCLSVLF